MRKVDLKNYAQIEILFKFDAIFEANFMCIHTIYIYIFSSDMCINKFKILEKNKLHAVYIRILYYTIHMYILIQHTHTTYFSNTYSLDM